MSKDNVRIEAPDEDINPLFLLALSDDQQDAPEEASELEAASVH